jgi:hypothetical protein
MQTPRKIYYKIQNIIFKKLFFNAAAKRKTSVTHWLQIVYNIHTTCGGHRPAQDLIGLLDFIQDVLAGSGAERGGALGFCNRERLQHLLTECSRKAVEEGFSLH